MGEQRDSVQHYLSRYVALRDSIDEITRTEAVMQVHQRQVEQENARLALQSSGASVGYLDWWHWC